MRVTKLHQIEITSNCNLKCRYCLHPKGLNREKQDMDREVYLECLRQVSISVAYHGQQELNLCGVGESTMHPDFVEYVALAREAVGESVALVLATNGILFNEEMARAIAPYKPRVAVSTHRPEVAGPAVELCRKYGMYLGASDDAATAAIDWAGQVEWHVSAPISSCMWLYDGRVMVASDGDIYTCCLDGTGDGIIGNIMRDKVTDLEVKPYSLCDSCNQLYPMGEK